MLKDKKAVFICQITEGALKVIKCVLGGRRKVKFLDSEIESIPPVIDDKILAERLKQALSRLGYARNPVIVSLPCAQATSRYLKIPSCVPAEIEKITGLQAASYLPYSAEELITGYEVISTDKQGYSYINLVIVNKNIIERYVRLFNIMQAHRLTIGLSSYGLCNFYNYINPDETRPVMVIDLDSHQAELIVIFSKKLLFSRAFKINRLMPNWESFFIEEVNKSRDAYLKEVSTDAPVKLIILERSGIPQDFIASLNKQLALPVEILPYREKISFAGDLGNRIFSSGYSFSSLLGFGLEGISESLNLLPAGIKEEAGKFSRNKERVGLILFSLATILIIGLGIAKNLDNKTAHLKQLQTELNKITKEAKPLEEIEKRLEIMAKQAQKRVSGLDVLYELHQIQPAQIFLANFSYEDDKQIILRGQTQELNSVFTFIRQLEKSPVFKDFSAKVKYATQRKTQAGEIIDFEIGCLKK